MDKNAFFLRLNQLDSSFLVLLALAGLGVAVGFLFYTGLLGWALRGLGFVVRGSIRQGFLLWERFFAWASWSTASPHIRQCTGFSACCKR